MAVCPTCSIEVPPEPGWCPRCLAVPADPGRYVIPPDPDVRPPRIVSSTSPGALSYGWLGRVLVSLSLLLFACFAYRFLMPFFVLQAFGTPGLILYVAFVGPVIAYVLYRIWRPVRVG